MQKTIEKFGKIIKNAKGVIFRDPISLYREEMAFVNKPFYFSGNNGKAVLLIHGWSSVPYEVRRLGTHLNEAGYTSSGPMLPGHGTVPKDLENVCWEDWLAEMEKNYLELKERHERVFVAGTSIGASLAIMMAKKYPDLDGLVLMAAPYKIKYERLIIFLAKLHFLFKKYNKKIYPPTFGAKTTITRLISYQSYPVISALETFELIKEARNNLEKIHQPCFLLQSRSDHIIAGNSLEKIFQRIGSKIKQKKYVKRAYHTFISDIRNESVFEEILRFLDKN